MWFIIPLHVCARTLLVPTSAVCPCAPRAVTVHGTDLLPARSRVSELRTPYACAPADCSPSLAVSSGPRAPSRSWLGGARMCFVVTAAFPPSPSVGPSALTTLHAPELCPPPPPPLELHSRSSPPVIRTRDEQPHGGTPPLELQSFMGLSLVTAHGRALPHRDVVTTYR